MVNTRTTTLSPIRADARKIFSSIVIVNMFVAYIFYIFAPSSRVYLLAEDQIVENLSAFLYLLAFFIGLIMLSKFRKKNWRIITSTSLGILGFLDEISFGGRIFSYNYPRIFDVKIDGLHDFFYFSAKMIKILGDSFGIVIYLGVFVLFMLFIVIIFMIFKRKKNLIAKVVVKLDFFNFYNWYWYAMVFASFIFLALILDLHIIKWEPLVLLEELLEMNAALALIFSCVNFETDRDNVR